MKSIQNLLTLFAVLVIYSSCTKKEIPVKNDIWNLVSITGSSETIRKYTIPGYHNGKQIYTYNFISSAEKGTFKITQDAFSGEKIAYTYSILSNTKDYVDNVLVNEINSTSRDPIYPENKTSICKRPAADSIIFTEGTFIKTPLPVNSQNAPTECKYKIEGGKMTITTVSNYRNISTPYGYPDTVTIKATTTVVLEKQ
jgi:hypothetical protein